MKKSAVFSKKLKISLLALLLLVLNTCVLIPVKPVKQCQQDPGIYQNALRLLASRYKGLEGKISVQLQTAKGKLTFSGHLYAKNPDSIRFSIYGIFHQLKFLLVKQGERLAWKDFDSGRQYQGFLDACPDFPAHLPFSPGFMRDFTRILFLNFPSPVVLSTTGRTPELCQFNLSCAWGLFGLTVDPEYNLPLRIEKAGTAGFSVSFTDYISSSVGVVPRAYTMTAHGMTMKIRFRTLKINPSFQEGIFTPSLPH